MSKPGSELRLPSGMYACVSCYPSNQVTELPAGLKVVASRRQFVGMRPLLEPMDEGTRSQLEGTELLDAADGRLFHGVKEKITAEGLPSIPQPGDDVVITCLGTGSAMPGKYRNGVFFLLVQRHRLQLNSPSQWPSASDSRAWQCLDGLR